MAQNDHTPASPAPELYAVYHGSAWFAFEKTLMSAPVFADGTIDWENTGEVENIERDEFEGVRSICLMLGIDDATHKFVVGAA